MVEAGPAALENKPVLGTETVLLVEDEQSILKLTQTLLERLGYTVLAALTPSAALAQAAQYAGPLHLILTDVVMPEMDGRELQGKIAALRPGIKALFMSGYTADVIARRGLIEEGVQFLRKPFSLYALSTSLREALNRKT